MPCCLPACDSGTRRRRAQRDRLTAKPCSSTWRSWPWSTRTGRTWCPSPGRRKVPEDLYPRCTALQNTTLTVEVMSCKCSPAGRCVTPHPPKTLQELHEESESFKLRSIEALFWIWIRSGDFDPLSSLSPLMSDCSWAVFVVWQDAVPKPGLLPVTLSGTACEHPREHQDPRFFQLNIAWCDHSLRLSVVLTLWLIGTESSSHYKLKNLL